MKTSTIPTLLGPDGMTSLREYAGYQLVVVQELKISVSMTSDTPGQAG